MQKELNVKINNIYKNENKNIELVTGYKMCVGDILKENFPDTYEKMLGVRVNNNIRTLDYKLVEDSVVEPLYYTSAEGYKIYCRTVKFLLYMALKRCYPKIHPSICNTIEDTMYFMCKDAAITEEMADVLQNEMKRIIANNSKIEKLSVPYEEAKAIYGDSLYLEEGLDIKLRSQITLYFCEDVFANMQGVLAPVTCSVNSFKIKPFRRGFALICPKRHDENIIDEVVEENIIYSVFEENDDYLNTIGIKSVADLNESIISGRFEDVVKINEVLHDNKMADIVANIKKKATVKMVFVAGPSSSGKTTFAHKLGLNLKLLGYNPVTISMDNYFKDRQDTPRLENGEYDFETIDAMDLDLFNEHLMNLVRGKRIEMPNFDFLRGKKRYTGDYIKLNPNDILIIEGIHALNPVVSRVISEELKYKIYIAPMTALNLNDFSKISTTDTRMIRRIVRDNRTRGYSVEETLNMWSNIMRGEMNYIYPYIKHADYIFNTSLAYELSVIKLSAMPLLLQVKPESEVYSEARRLYGLLNNFLPQDSKYVPDDSLLREFIGK